MSFVTRVLSLAALTTLGVFGTAGARADSFSAILPPGATFSSTVGINGGVVIGNYNDASGAYGFTYDGTTYTTINAGDNFNQITGFSGSTLVGYRGTSGSQRGFVYDGSGYTILAYPGAMDTQAMAVNSAGKVVGQYSNISGSTSSYVWSGGSSYAAVSDPSAVYGTYATGFLNSGAVFGTYYDASYSQHAFVYDGSTYTNFDVPGSQGTFIVDDNAGGMVAGYYNDGSYKSHGFLYDGTSFTFLNYPGANNGTVITGITDDGKVIGYYRDLSYTTHGFLYDGSSFVSVDDPSAAHGSLLAGIEGNVLVGTSYGPTYHGTGFEATLDRSGGPTAVPAPASVWGGAVLMAALAIARRRRGAARVA